jgi:hypothetical protein
MEKEFINYIEALALKELGFNEPCFGFYCDEGSRVEPHYPCDGLNRAPTYSQAFRWFREKHGLISYIHPLALLENDGLWCYEITNFSNNWDESFDLHSPEEAQLECLKKLIEIVKEK